jgi:predicted nucleic acid-binding protein
MRFWDSSAVVPLLCIEEESRSMRRLYQEDNDLLVWGLTRTEAVCALCRRARDGSLSRKQFSVAKERLRSLRSDWSEIIDYDGVRERGERLLEVHSLSAADALQLGAALVAVNERTAGFVLVTLDMRLRLAAEKEGFTVVPGDRRIEGRAHARISRTTRPPTSLKRKSRPWKR